jgi:sugar phosphate permease
LLTGESIVSTRLLAVKGLLVVIICGFVANSSNLLTNNARKVTTVFFFLVLLIEQGSQMVAMKYSKCFLAHFFTTQGVFLGTLPMLFLLKMHFLNSGCLFSVPDALSKNICR